jgi:shikimate kinase
MKIRAVFLVGFMASGKTTLARELARRLDWDFVDLDARIESRERLTIPEIFRDRGESAFRLAETSALRDLTESLHRNTVVALGGGTFAQPENRELLRSWPSVFLEVPLHELWRRTREDPAKRPLRKDSLTNFGRLYESRLPSYRQATMTVVTSGTGDPASVCGEIESKLQLRDSEKVSESFLHPAANFGTGESQ